MSGDARPSQRTLHNTLNSDSDPIVIPLDERHVEPAKKLWSDRFGGTEEHTDTWLREARIDVDKPTQGFAAVDRGTLVGFGIATVGDPDYVRDYIGVDVDVDPWPWTGVLHILVVDSDYEGQGIGSNLVWHRLNWLTTTDAEGVIGISWHRENHRDSRPLFEKFDFERVETVDEYYAKLEGPCPCVDCEGACRCDATIYRRPFAGDSSE